MKFEIEDSIVPSLRKFLQRPRLSSSSVTPSLPPHLLLILLHFIVSHISFHHTAAHYLCWHACQTKGSHSFPRPQPQSHTLLFSVPNSLKTAISKDSDLTSSSLSHSLLSVISPFRSSFSAFRNSLFLSVVRRISFVKREEQISIGGVVLEGL